MVGTIGRFNRKYQVYYQAYTKFNNMDIPTLNVHKIPKQFHTKSDGDLYDVIIDSTPTPLSYFHHIHN